jgi:hypothetical protein
MNCATLGRLLAENEIRFLSEAALQGLRALQWVDLRSNPLLTVHHRAFSDLPVLNKLLVAMFIIKRLQAYLKLRIPAIF